MGLELGLGGELVGDAGVVAREAYPDTGVQRIGLEVGDGWADGLAPTGEVVERPAVERLLCEVT